MKVYTIGTVKIDCKDKSGTHVLVELYDIVFSPQAKVNLVSLQKMRKAEYIIVQPPKIGTRWILNKGGSA